LNILDKKFIKIRNYIQLEDTYIVIHLTADFFYLFTRKNTKKFHFVALNINYHHTLYFHVNHIILMGTIVFLCL